MIAKVGFVAWVLSLCSLSSQAQIAENSANKLKPRLNHIALQVSNLAKSTLFYQETLGLDTIPEPFHDGRHTWFDIGGSAHLHIIVGVSGKPVIPTKQTHICFSVNSINNFIGKLKRLNIPWEDWPGQAGTITTRPDGVRQIYFQDPDGYWIEVNDDYPK